MNSTLVSRNVFLCAAAILIASCGTATFTKTGSDATIESLRSFHLAFIDEFAVPGKEIQRHCIQRQSERRQRKISAGHRR